MAVGQGSDWAGNHHAFAAELLLATYNQNNSNHTKQFCDTSYAHNTMAWGGTQSPESALLISTVSFYLCPPTKYHLLADNHNCRQLT